MTEVTTALNTALSGISTSAMSVLKENLPAALTIVSASIVITLGIKVFKRVTGKA